MAARTPVFNQKLLYDTTPLPEYIPRVDEIGCSSAPLMSASYFIGARCRDYNDDFMQCKNENPGRGAFMCLKEGRRVTRCAQSVLDDMHKSCLVEWRRHWQCLENYNQQLWNCRPAEWKLNKCVYNSMGLVKEIPDTRPNAIPVHLRPTQIFAKDMIPSSEKPFVPPETKHGNVQASLQ